VPTPIAPRTVPTTTPLLVPKGEGVAAEEALRALKQTSEKGAAKGRGSLVAAVTNSQVSGLKTSSTSLEQRISRLRLRVPPHIFRGIQDRWSRNDSEINRLQSHPDRDQVERTRREHQAIEAEIKKLEAAYG
jgi:hypothetical protein